MNKSIVILLCVIWVLCTLYFTLAKVNDYPYTIAAMIGAWASSILLLACIVIFVRKHNSNK